MRIAIDISQIAHEGTGVAKYTKNLVEKLLEIDKENEYVLFYSSLRKPWKIQNSKLKIQNHNVKVKSFRLAPTLLDLLWNRLHIFPVERLIGDVDVFLSSDWVQPPSKKAKMVTVIHDLSPLKFPKEHHPKIVSVHKRRLKWAEKECDMIICDSSATMQDVVKLLGIDKTRLKIICPGGGERLG